MMVRIFAVINLVFKIFPRCKNSQNSSCSEKSCKDYFYISIHIILSFGFLSSKRCSFFACQYQSYQKFKILNKAFYSSVGFFNSSVIYNCLTFLSVIILNQEIKKCKEKISYRCFGLVLE